MTDKERYALIGTWVEVFREEGVDVSDATISRRLKEAGIIGETARIRIGRVIRAGFYAESDVRRLCADLFVGFPQADEEGLIHHEGQVYGTVGSLSRLLGVSKTAISDRLKNHHLPFIQGRQINGRLRKFFFIEDVRELCCGLLGHHPQADEDGLIRLDGSVYGTVKSLSRLLSISETAIQARIQATQVKPIQGKDRGGRICDFYPLIPIRNLCAELLQNLPQADEEGIIRHEGHDYGTVSSLSRLLGISQRTISERVKKHSLQVLRGKNQAGRVFDFYSVAEVRALCAGLLMRIPQADEENCLVINGEQYRTISAWSRIFGLHSNTLKKRIETSGAKLFKAKASTGSIRDFYSGVQVRECQDLFQKLPQAGEDGLIVQGGKVYGPMKRLAKLIGVSTSSIRRRIAGKQLPSIQGKAISGNAGEFFLLSAVRALCADLIAKKPKK